MNTATAVQTFIARKQQQISMEYDDTSAYSRMLQQSYMVGVLESTLTTVLDFIEIRYGEEAKNDAMKRGCIIK
jgi:hypothetical protein